MPRQHRSRNPYDRRNPSRRGADGMMAGEVGYLPTFNAADLSAMCDAAYRRGRQDEAQAAADRTRDVQRLTWDEAHNIGYEAGARMATDRAFGAVVEFLNGITAAGGEEDMAARRTTKDKLLHVIAHHAEVAQALHRRATAWMQDPAGDFDTKPDDVDIPF